MIQIRCSSLGLIERCAAAAVKPDMVIERTNQAAEMGTFLHSDAIMAGVIDKKHIELERLAAEAGLPLGQVRHLYHNAQRLWDAFGHLFPNPVRERERRIVTGDVELTGHPDLESVVNKQVRIGDFKSGRLEDSADAQLRGYAWLVLNEHPECDTAYVAALRIAGTPRLEGGRTYSRAELSDWWCSLVEKVEKAAYTPSEKYCWRCPRLYSCEASKAVLGSSVETLLQGKLAALPTEPVERARVLGQLYYKAKIAKSFIEELENFVKAECDAQGGRMDIGNGEEIVRRQEFVSKIRLTPKSKEMIQSVIGGKIDNCLTVNKSKLKDEVYAQAAYGQKKREMDDLMFRLQTSGSIEESVRLVTEVRQKPMNVKALEDKTDGTD